jgi:hypothetical protein
VLGTKALTEEESGQGSALTNSGEFEGLGVQDTKTTTLIHIILPTGTPSFYPNLLFQFGHPQSLM